MQALGGDPWTALEFLPLILLCAFLFLKNPVTTKACSRENAVSEKVFFPKENFSVVAIRTHPPRPHKKSVKTFKVAHTKHRCLKRQEGTGAVIEPTLGRVEVL